MKQAGSCGTFRAEELLMPNDEQIEAAIFMHFLANSYALMTIEELQKGVPLHVTSQDFLLGVADLTGEVMR